MAKPVTIATEEDAGEPLNVIGTKISILASAKQTGGQEYTIQRGAEGTGPPPHSHPWDEAFYVLEGSVDFGLGEEVVTAGPGTLVHVPGGTTHAFSFGPGGGKILEMTSKESRAATLFAGLEREVPPGPPDIGIVRKVFGENGVSLDI